MGASYSERLIVEPGTPMRLADHDAGGTPGCDGKKDAKKRLKPLLAQLYDLQYRMYAEDKKRLLLVLQGMDAAGKSGTVRCVMGGLNPLGCETTSFKKPSKEELDHGYLWRIHKAVPRRGNIGVFDRSHYEDVLVVRVAELVPEDVWRPRYEEINRFEQMLADNDTIILKFFLNISKDEQKARLQERLDNPERRWKVAPYDFVVRKQWDDYMAAYEEALTRCSTAHAPWYVIPSDNKWFRNLAVTSIIVEALAAQNMQFPPPSTDLSKIVLE